MGHLSLLYFFITICLGVVSLTLMALILYKTKERFLLYLFLFFLIFSIFVVATSFKIYLNTNLQDYTLRTSFILNIIMISSQYFIPLFLVVLVHYISFVNRVLLKNIILIILIFFSVFYINYSNRERLIDLGLYYYSKLYLSEIIFIAIFIYLIFACICNYKKIKDIKFKKITKQSTILTIIFLPAILNDIFYFFDFFPGFYFFPLLYCSLSVVNTGYVINNYLSVVGKIKNINDYEKVLSDDFYAKYNLSEREKDIFLLIIKGYSNKRIADSLFISISTVKKHIYNIFKKTKINTRFELLSLVKENN